MWWHRDEALGNEQPANNWRLFRRVCVPTEDRAVRHPRNREQAPEFGSYFNPDNAEGLAGALRRAWQTHDPRGDAAMQRRAEGNLLSRQRTFERTFETIVRNALDHPTPRASATDLR